MAAVPIDYAGTQFTPWDQSTEHSGPHDMTEHIIDGARPGGEKGALLGMFRGHKKANMVQKSIISREVQQVKEGKPWTLYTTNARPMPIDQDNPTSSRVAHHTTKPTPSRHSIHKNKRSTFDKHPVVNKPYNQFNPLDRFTLKRNTKQH